MKNLKVLLCIETKNAKFNTFARQSLWPTIAMCIIVVVTGGIAMYNVKIVYSCIFY